MPMPDNQKSMNDLVLERQENEGVIKVLRRHRDEAEELLIATYKILARRQDTPPLAEAKMLIMTAAHSAVKNEDRFFNLKKVLEDYNII